MKIHDNRNFNMPNSNTKAGNYYDIPKGMNSDDFYNLIYEFVNLAKEKGLTIRQAQYLFEVCSDYVLENKLI